MRHKESKEVHSDRLMINRKHGRMEGQRDEKARIRFMRKPYGRVREYETKEEASDRE